MIEQLRTEFFETQRKYLANRDDMVWKAKTVRKITGPMYRYVNRYIQQESARYMAMYQPFNQHVDLNLQFIYPPEYNLRIVLDSAQEYNGLIESLDYQMRAILWYSPISKPKIKAKYAKYDGDLIKLFKGREESVDKEAEYLKEGIKLLNTEINTSSSAKSIANDLIANFLSADVESMLNHIELNHILDHYRKYVKKLKDLNIVF